MRLNVSSNSFRNTKTNVGRWIGSLTRGTGCLTIIETAGKRSIHIRPVRLVFMLAPFVQILASGFGIGMKASNATPHTLFHAWAWPLVGIDESSRPIQKNHHAPVDFVFLVPVLFVFLQVE